MYSAKSGIREIVEARRGADGTIFPWTIVSARCYRLGGFYRWVVVYLAAPKT